MAKSTTTIRFRGLCVFVEQNKAMDAYLLDPGKVSASEERGIDANLHLTSLTIPIKQIDINRTTVPATAIVDSPDGTQLGVWRIKAKDEIRLTGVTPAKPKWQQRDISIDLRELHADALSMKRKDIVGAGAALFELTNGVMSCPEIVEDPMELIREGDAAMSRPIARTVAWRLTGDDNDVPVLMFKSGGAEAPIFLKPNATITVTNAAQVVDGLDHFAHYYSIFSKQPEKKFKLKRTANALRVDVPVYDCIPPTGGPDPEP